MDSLPEKLIADLRQPAGYPLDPDAAAGVEWIQTHLSHVFLTATRVYKLRKAAVLPFVDFGSREERNRDCLREVELNRRLAPDVYLGVAPVQSTPAGYVLGEATASLASGSCEHVVVMRRLADGCDTLSLLERGDLEASHLEAVAERLASFHASHRLAAPAPWSPSDWLARVDAPMQACLESLNPADGSDDSNKAHARLTLAWRERLAGCRVALEERRRAGRAVDGHGDLHLQHIWFERPNEPLFIDCVEFDAELRRVDAASEVAFLAMDLRYRGRGDLAERFLSAYAAAADDYGLYAVVDLYAAYRAAVRAKVAAIAARDPDISGAQRSGAAQSAERHTALALEFLTPRLRGALVLTCGTVGTGKSTVAAALGEQLGATIIRSDRIRKVLAGLAPEQHAASPPDTGLYAPERVAAVYGELLERAAEVLRSGRSVILDATFSRGEQRARARNLAAREGVPVFLVEVSCSGAVARERLQLRAASGTDASDAGPELLETSRAHYQPPVEWPSPFFLQLRTDSPSWRGALVRDARQIAEAAAR